MARVALVTGATRGLGKAVCAQLAGLPGTMVIPTGRSLQAIVQSRADIARLADNEDSVFKPIVVDVTNRTQIREAARMVKEEFGGLDVLINNHGIFDKRDKQIKEMIDINYFGTLHMIEEFLPLMRPGGRVVNLAAKLGELKQFSPQLQEAIKDPSLSVDQLTRFVQNFLDKKKDEVGFSGRGYMVSKGAVIALTSILARQNQTHDLLFSSMDPGWCKTDMGGSTAPLTPEQGAERILHCATLPSDSPSGMFWWDMKPHAIL